MGFLFPDDEFRAAAEKVPFSSSLSKAADGCVPPAELCFFFQTIQNRPEKGSLLLLLFFLLPPLKKERSPIQVQTQTQLKKEKKNSVRNIT